jgi:hypothetical protein
MTHSSDAAIAPAWSKETVGVQRSIRYHARRQRFFEFWNSLTNAAGIILGAATVVALTGKWLPWPEVLRVVFPVVITILSTLNLVWGTTRRAREHNDLYRRFVALEARVRGATSIDETMVRSLRAERLAIEADEPPTMFALDVLCHNEVVRAVGADDYYEVGFWYRWTAQFLAFPNAKFAPLRKKTT